MVNGIIQGNKNGNIYLMRKALVVGINDYPHGNHLKGCINDASSFSGIIAANGDGSPNFAVKLETDVPTKSKLKGLIKDLFSGDCETSLLYFSGHGLLDDVGGLHCNAGL
jgi:hypothetical protein